MAYLAYRLNVRASCCRGAVRRDRSGVPVGRTLRIEGCLYCVACGDYTYRPGYGCIACGYVDLGV